MSENKQQTFLSLDIEVVEKQIAAIGVSKGKIDSKMNPKIDDGKSFYGAVKYDERKLSSFWKDNIKKLKFFEENAISQNKMAEQVEKYIVEQQKLDPNFIFVSDFGSFDIGILNKWLESHNKKPLRFRRNEKSDFFMDVDITSFAAGVLFALSPMNAFNKGWEWGLFEKIFQKLGINPKNEFEHDHNPQNDASKNLSDFLSLLEHGMKNGIVGKKRKVDDDEYLPNKKAKLV